MFCKYAADVQQPAGACHSAILADVQRKMPRNHSTVVARMVDMCVDMCMDMCIDLCIDICVDI